MTGLEDAKLRITSSAELATGEESSPITYTIPLATFSQYFIAHITIRYPDGEFGGPLRPGVNEILTDYWFPGRFLEPGYWTFKIEAMLPAEEGTVEQRYLFCMQTSQWLEGRMRL